MNGLRRVAGLAGVSGAVLFVFGAVTYAVTRRFDLWTAIHFTGGGILAAVGLITNLPQVWGVARSRAGRFRLRALAGVVAFVVLLVAVNGIVDRLDLRWDVTEAGVHELSPSAREELTGLDDELELIAFWDATDPDRRDVERLLERVEVAAATGRVRVVDPTARPDVAAGYGIERDRTLIVQSGEREARERFERRPVDEAAVLELIRRVTATGPRDVIVYGDRGALDVFDSASAEGGALFAATLAEAAFRVRRGSLASDATDVDDIAFAALIGPSKPLSDLERERLLEWLDHGGSTLLMLEPGIDPALGAALAERGVRLGGDVVLDPESTPAGGARAGVEFLTAEHSPHPAVLGNDEPIRLRLAQSVEATSPEAEVVTHTRATAWAERDVETLVRAGRASPGPDDRAGPVPIAVALERPDRGLRAIVVGDADAVRNARISGFGNRRWILGIASWLAHEEGSPATTRARSRPSRLDLTETRFRALFRLGVILVPEAVFLVGLAIWWWRRSL